jgi:hypothetical protein
MTYGEVSLCVEHAGHAPTLIDGGATLELLRRHMDDYTDTSLPAIDAVLRAAAEEIDATQDLLRRRLAEMSLHTTRDYIELEGPPEEDAFSHLHVLPRPCSVSDCLVTSTHQISTSGDDVAYFCENHYYTLVRGEVVPEP